MTDCEDHDHFEIYFSDGFQNASLAKRCCDVPPCRALAWRWAEALRIAREDWEREAERRLTEAICGE